MIIVGAMALRVTNGTEYLGGWIHVDGRNIHKLWQNHILWVVKVERFQWNERPSCAHATSKVDQCCVQLVSSKLVFFSFLTFSWVLHCQRLCVTSYLGCVYTMFSWSHERTMKGNERKWKEHESKWIQRSGFWYPLTSFDTSIGRRSKQLTVSLQNPTGKSSFSCDHLQSTCGESLASQYDMSVFCCI